MSDPYYTTDITENINLKVGKGTVYINSERGLDKLDRFANNHNWLTLIANIGILVTIVTAILSVALFALSAISSIGTTPTPANNPQNAVIIPGVNDFIPIHATFEVIFVIVVSAAVHEISHALLAFRSDYPVEEWGVVLLLGIIPLGAYVKIPPENIDDGDLWSSLRVLAAGILGNYILFAATIILAILLNIPLVDGMQYYLQALPNVSGPEEISLLTSVAFWMAFLNINLAAINSLPVYGLDGGHMMDIICRATVPNPFKEEVIAIVTATTLFVVSGVFFIPFIT